MPRGASRAQIHFLDSIGHSKEDGAYKIVGGFMIKYEFHRNDVSVEVYAHKDSTPSSEAILAAIRILQAEMIRRETHSRLEESL